MRAIRFIAMIIMVVAAVSIRDSEGTKAIVLAFLVGTGVGIDIVNALITFAVRHDSSAIRKMEKAALKR